MKAGLGFSGPFNESETPNDVLGPRNSDFPESVPNSNRLSEKDLRVPRPSSSFLSPLPGPAALGLASPTHPPNQMACTSAGAPPWAAQGHPPAPRRLLLGLRPPSPPALPTVVCCRATAVSSGDSATGTTERPLTLREICRARLTRICCSVHAAELRISALLYLQKSKGNRYRFFYLARIAFYKLRLRSGKTLAYLLLIFSAINFQRSAVQALIVVPTRELGMQVTRVARMLAAKPTGYEMVEETCTIMALLDGGMLKRHKSWLKAEPPKIVVATIGSLCQMLERHVLKLEAIHVLVVDEVDFMFNSSKQVQSLRKLLTSYSTIDTRQTIFASASIPQHNRFLYDCVQQKWTKKDAVHVHVNGVQPLPSCLRHRYLTCRKKERLKALLLLLQRDAPRSGIIFVNDQSEKSKKAGDLPSTLVVLEFLKASYSECLEVILLEEEMNFNARATSLSEVRQGGCLLVATDIAGRGVDLPETTHIYNFDLPKTAVDYLHRAGRTGRRPFSDVTCIVTSLISQEERFVLQRFENELMFECEELQMMSLKLLHDDLTHLMMASNTSGICRNKMCPTSLFGCFQLATTLSSK
ncbi:hypothetical protein Taro_008621 [Colocasia esculenta]|uniref:RNA helicase n=1 Tax=Colocasia esculenta TaxID=4460 RepID=A0A843TY51_COLES|nr:hypothetical protein [Colocasia esculenta]